MQLLSWQSISLTTELPRAILWFDLTCLIALDVLQYLSRYCNAKTLFAVYTYVSVPTVRLLRGNNL